MKRIINGLSFRAGFSLLLVSGLIASVGISCRSLRWHATEKAEGVFIVSTNLVRTGEDIAANIVLTNTTEHSFPNLVAWKQLENQDGQVMGFGAEPFQGPAAHAQRNFTFVFENVDRTNSINDLSFKIDLYKDDQKN